MLTADCGYNNTCLAYDTYDGSDEEIEGYCQFPELPGDYYDTSGEASLYLVSRSHKPPQLSRLCLPVLSTLCALSTLWAQSSSWCLGHAHVVLAKAMLDWLHMQQTNFSSMLHHLCLLRR